MRVAGALLARPAAPWLVTESMTFGSAIDAAVEIAVTALRAGMSIPLDRCMAAATEVALRDDNPVSLDEVERAAELFGVSVAPEFDWSHAQTQQTVRVPIDGLGECEGHPDLLMPDPILDVKTSTRPKSEADVYFGSELGFYALLRERDTGEPVQRVGYLTWVRLKKPYWQVLVVDVTDDLRAKAMTRARRQLHIRKLSDTVSEKGPTRRSTSPARASIRSALSARGKTCVKWASAGCVGSEWRKKRERQSRDGRDHKRHGETAPPRWPRRKARSGPSSAPRPSL